MGYDKVIENIIEDRLLELSTAYLAKVISVKGRRAKIQPLGKVKEIGKKEQTQSVLTSVPFPKHIEKLEKDDIVLCVCCDRNITEALKGRNVLPPCGHHSKSDSIIIGVF